MITSEHANFPRASFMRRFGAMMYDLLLAIAVYMLVGTVGFALFTLLVNNGVIAKEGAEHVSDLLNGTQLYLGLYQLWNLSWVCVFYALFWSRGGQTLGMRAWRLKVQHPNGQNLSFITSCARIVWSGFGAGNLWIVLHRDKLALQDKMTHSEVVVLSKEANQMRNWYGA